MEFEWDEKKRETTLRQRGLDFSRAGEFFKAKTVTLADDRRNYGEVRYQTYGFLDERVVMIVWTPRGDVRRIISMRECDVGERRLYHQAMAGRG